MPREQITHNRLVVRHKEELDNPAPMDALVQVEVMQRNVHVTWDRDGLAGLALEVTVSDLRDLLAQAEIEAAAAARNHGGLIPVDGGAGVEYDVDSHQIRVHSTNLDRADLNRTINALRRARDVAYGKDA